MSPLDSESANPMASSPVQLRRQSKTERLVTRHAKSCKDVQESTAESGREETRWRAFRSIVVGDSGGGAGGATRIICLGLALEDAGDDWDC